MSRALILSFLLWPLFFLLSPSSRNVASAATGGKWDLLQSNVGISAMHMQLLHTDKVVMYDRTDFGQSNISLPGGKCIIIKAGKEMKVDCTAHSVEYDVIKNSIRPLTVLTDIWCSSGGVSPDGTLLQTGGYQDGDHVARTYQPCNGCDWQEFNNSLIKTRWYSTNQRLPDGRMIIVGGRRQFNYEFYPKFSLKDKVNNLGFLVETNDYLIENNLYPFVFLNVDGNLFIFANNRAILFDYKKNIVVRSYPKIVGGEPRNYPSTGSAVLLPLKNLEDSQIVVEVLICGGAPNNSYHNAKKRRHVFVEALNTCGRMNINEKNPKWTMETMPLPRVMGDMLLLPNGDVLIINGARSGTAGWEYGRDPVLYPVVYRPDNSVGSRFEVQNPSKIPRMYHSTAALVRDGRVLVGGSNPHEHYKFTGVLYPTELSLESFSPSYLSPEFAAIRPRITRPVLRPIVLGYGMRTKFRFVVRGVLNPDLVKVTMIAPPFNTHSFSMNQRLLVLTKDPVTPAGRSTYEIKVRTPASGNQAPSGYYLLSVVHQDIPSESVWVQLK